MSSYRISSLFALPPAFDRIKFRKAMNAMSVHAVSRRWLQADAGLDAREVDSLLSLLDEAGVLLGPFPDAPDEGEALPRESAWRLAGQLLRERWRALSAPRAQSRPERTVPPEESRAAARPTAAGWLDDLSAAALENIADELHELLTRHPGARRALVHLSVLECTLRYRDAAAARALPVELLRSALDQLQAVGVPAGRTGLAILRMRLMQAVLRHGDEERRAPSGRSPIRSPSGPHHVFTVGGH